MQSYGYLKINTIEGPKIYGKNPKILINLKCAILGHIDDSLVKSVITQVFLEIVEKESILEVTTNQPSDAKSSQSASREGSLFMIYLCS